jgi:hypothetical protein
MPGDVGNVNVVAVDHIEEDVSVGSAIQIGDGGGDDGEDDDSVKEDVSISRPPAARSQQGLSRGRVRGPKMADGSPSRGQWMVGAP